MWVDKEGVETKLECHWTVFERRTHYSLKASYKVENCKTGAAMAAGEASTEASDLKKYIEAGGDEDLLPSDLKDLPRSPSEPRGEPALAQECADRAAEALGLELFKNFK